LLGQPQGAQPRGLFPHGARLGEVLGRAALVDRDRLAELRLGPITHLLRSVCHPYLRVSAPAFLRIALVPRTRSSHSLAASPIANFGFKRGTSIIDLPVSLGFRSSHESVLQGFANFGIGTLERDPLRSRSLAIVVTIARPLHGIMPGSRAF